MKTEKTFTHIGAVLARTNSSRCYNKNNRIVKNGKRICEYTLNRLQESNVCNEFIISTDDTKIARQLRLKYHNDPDINIHSNSSAHTGCVDTTAAKIVSDYSNVFSNIETVTVIYGTVFFWDPEWIRQAHHILENHRVKENDNVSILTVQADLLGCYVYRIAPYEPVTPPRIYTLPYNKNHFYIDINTEDDLTQALKYLKNSAHSPS